MSQSGQNNVLFCGQIIVSFYKIERKVLFGFYMLKD